MQCACAEHPLHKLSQPRATPRAATYSRLQRSPSTLQLSGLRNVPNLHARRVWCGAAAVPPLPGGSDSAGAGAPSLAAGGHPNITLNNDTAHLSASAATSKASLAGSSGGAAGSEAVSDTCIVTVSGRSNFRSVLRRSYLGEGLFVVIGSLICAAVAQWTVGTPLRRFNPYSFCVLLPQATNVVPGTPVRMKGVAMGSVLSASPLLDKVRVEVEVNEAKTIIPRGARFELTQSGMIPSANLDITTPEGVSAEVLAAMVAARSTAASGAGAGPGPCTGDASRTAEAEAAAAAAAAAAGTAFGAGGRSVSHRAGARVRLAGPKDVSACRLQGVLVCQGDQLDGLQGGSMDELMAHMLKTLRQGESAAAAEGNGIVPGRGPVQG